VPRPSFLHPFARPSAGADDFLSIERGSGAVVHDREGRAYLDATASLWYCQVGHGREEIAAAVADQLRTLDAFHCFDLFTNGPADALCDRLAALAPFAGARVFLTDSGSEAVDTAIKLSRLRFARTGDERRHVIVGRRHAYHGTTYGGLSVTGLPANLSGWGPLVGGAGGEHRIEHDELTSAEAQFAEHGDQIAAVIAEPVIAAGGVHPPPPGYLEGLRALCDEHGALLILDEVVSGFGRLGRWWGAERYGVRADLITFAKGVTSGYQPLGGVLVGPAVLDVLEADDSYVLRTGHTYSGHPAACRAASANIDLIRDEQLAERAASVIGPFFERELEGLRADGLVDRVRGVAGIWAVDLPPERSAVDVRSRLLDLGVIARPLGTTTIALCPPLVITDGQLDELIIALRTAIMA